MSRTLSIPSAPSGFVFRPAALPGMVKGVDVEKIESLCRAGCPFTYKSLAWGQDVVAVIEHRQLRFAEPTAANGQALQTEQEVIVSAREHLR